MYKYFIKYKNFKLIFILLISLCSIFLVINNRNKQSNFIETSDTTTSIPTTNDIKQQMSTTTVPLVSTTTVPLVSTITTTVPLVIVENLKDAQRELKKLYIYQGKVDGINGTYTRLAIKEFQKRSGLVEDGILGPKTKNALKNGWDSYINIGGQETVDLSSYEITDETKYIQIKLQELDIYTGDIDGIYGFQTMLSLKEFQRKAGLVSDGILDLKLKVL